MKALLTFITFMLLAVQLNAQDWWEKTKSEAVPADLKNTTLLVERFKTRKPDSAPEQAYLDPKKKDDHPLIKKTNDDLSTYNKELRDTFKAYKFPYKVISKSKAEDPALYATDTARYILKHEVYLRRHMESGRQTHFYTYLFYFHDRASGKDYPYIYLFEEKWEEGLKKLIGYLNQL